MGGGICLWQRPNAAMYSPHVPELAINEPFAIEVDHRRGGSKRRALAVVAIAFLGLGAFVALSGSDNAALDSTTAASTALSAADPTELLDWDSTECAQKQQSLCGYCGTDWRCRRECHFKHPWELHKACRPCVHCHLPFSAATELESKAQLLHQLCPPCSSATLGKAVQGPGGRNGSEFKAALAKCSKCVKAHTWQLLFPAGQDNATPGKRP